jgi:hypothetical protein
MANGPEESIGALVGRLADDARAYVHAEADYYRTLATERLGEARVGLALGSAALLLGLAAAIALIVGLVLTLATLVGPGWATLIVVLITSAIATGLGWLAYRRIAGVFRDQQ